MLKTILFAITILLSLSSCHKKEESFEYDDNQLTKAWEENDSTYLRNWILHLDDLEFSDFASRISEYAYETNFIYGSIDPEGDVNARWTKNQVEVLRSNMGRVYDKYNESCVFLNKEITKDDTYRLCLKYWRDSILSDQDIDSLRVDLQAICNKVNNSPVKILHKHL
jgi:hypothetical protein